MTRQAENQQTVEALTEDAQFEMRAKYRRLRLRHDDHFYGPMKGATCGCDICDAARDVLRCLDGLAALRDLAAQASRTQEWKQLAEDMGEALQWVSDYFFTTDDTGQIANVRQLLARVHDLAAGEEEK